MTEAAAKEDDIGSDDREVDEDFERNKALRFAEYNANKGAKPKPKPSGKTIVTLEAKA